ncbi:hypothetical protein RI054_12g60730 [Pseudoscourfieldia marina]
MDLRMVHDDNNDNAPSSPSSSSSILASPTTFSDVDSEGKPYDDNDSVCLACLNVCCVCGINRRVGGRFGTVAAGRNHQQDVSSSSSPAKGSEKGSLLRLRKSKQTAPPKQQRLPPLPPRKDATDNAAWTTSAVVGVAVAAGLFGTLVSIAVFALYFLPKIEMEQRPMETHAATMRAEW